VEGRSFPLEEKGFPIQLVGVRSREKLPNPDPFLSFGSSPHLFQGLGGFYFSFRKSSP